MTTPAEPYDDPVDFGVGQCREEVRVRDWEAGGYRLRRCLNETRDPRRYCWRHR